MQKLVEIRDLTVRYGNLTAVDRANLDIFDNDFIGIIGPNGGGKSTLVKAIMGTVPYSGEITLGKPILNGGKPLIGYMPQITTIDKAFPISVREVVLSGLQNSKGFLHRYANRDKLRVDELLSDTGILDIASRPLGELSGGQLQRALLCRAVISDPKLLILDEPANFVDNKFENELYSLLRRLNERMAVVMVSHDLGTISSFVKSIEELNAAWQAASQDIYAQQQAQGAAGNAGAQSGASSNASGSDNKTQPEDVEFEEVK